MVAEQVGVTEVEVEVEVVAVGMEVAPLSEEESDREANILRNILLDDASGCKEVIKNVLGV